MTLSPIHPALAGIATPALIVDESALECNIRRMAELARQFGVGLRPHAKTHKSAEIARRQIQAGAVGVACATVNEAEEMAAAGLAGLLVTAPTADQAKLARVAKLNREADLMVAVDHAVQVGRLLEVLQPGDPPLRLVIDTDIGHARTGIADVAAGVRLAQTIVQQPQLSLAGVQGYAGHVQHIADASERKAAAKGCSAKLRTFTDALRTSGLAPKLVSGSGTGAFLYERDGPYTELQAGSYVFMDADYARILDEAGQPPQFTPSLFVLATVVSGNRPGQVTVDAGTKSLATNGPPPCVLLGAPAGSTYRFAGDEHGIVSIPRDAESPPLGSRLLIGATHCDPTVNLHSSYHAVCEQGVEQWRILGRY